MNFTQGDYINIASGLINGFSNGRTWDCYMDLGKGEMDLSGDAAFRCFPNPGVAALASALGFYALWLDWNNSGVIIRWIVIGGVASAAGMVVGGAL